MKIIPKFQNSGKLSSKDNKELERELIIINPNDEFLYHRDFADVYRDSYGRRYFVYTEDNSLPTVTSNRARRNLEKPLWEHILKQYARNPRGMKTIEDAVTWGGNVAGASALAVGTAPIWLPYVAPAANMVGKVGKLALLGLDWLFKPTTYRGALLSSYVGAEGVNNFRKNPNVETGALATLGLLPVIPAAINGARSTYNISKNLYTKSPKYIFNNLPFFIKTPNSYTRGLGMGNEGILDLVRTGIVRGNPRGTEVTAHLFAKLFRRNRNHFRDIIKDTGIKDIESKYFSRTLNESEFNAIKEAAKKYKSNSFEIENNTIRFRNNSDPLSEYNTYNEYINSINKLIKEVNLMPQRVSSGEVEVNPILTQGEDRYLRGIPIKERFGPNSDYIGDGTPLTYWYPDGRNAFRKGYDYAGSKWMVKVDNASKHLPFMHELHLHPSFYKAIKLNDPDVSVYRKLPFGIGLKIPKSWLYTKFSK